MADYDKATFKTECNRRRNEGLIVKGNTFPIKDQIKELGGIWDGKEKQWLMPDQSAVAECNVALGLGDGPPPKAPAEEPEDLVGTDANPDDLPF